MDSLDPSLNDGVFDPDAALNESFTWQRAMRDDLDYDDTLGTDFEEDGTPLASSDRQPSDLSKLLEAHPDAGELSDIDLTAYRVGPVHAFDKERGTYFGDDYQSAHGYATAHEGHAITPYRVQARKAFVAKNLHQAWLAVFGKRLDLNDIDIRLKLRSTVKAGRWADAQLSRKLRAKGYDALIYREPAAPARHEIALIDKTAKATPLASAPRRAYESMTFDPPFAAPFGQILSYHWMSKPVGGMEGQRTSDWSQARTNAVTGRGIVHHFKVQKPDGTHTVSLETALGQLSDPQRQRLQGLIRAEQTRRADQASGQIALFSAPRITEPPFSTPESKALENTRIHAIDTYLHGTRRPIAKTPPANQAGSSRTQLQALLTHLRRGQRASGSSAGNEQTGRAEARQRDKALLIDWARNAGVLINAIPDRYQIDGPKDKGGREHHVFHDTSGRWVKITKGDGDAFGLQPLDEGGKNEWMLSPEHADVASYLEKLALHNQVFHDDIVLHGVVADPLGKVALIISQPDYEGTFAGVYTSIKPAMEAAGFVRVEPPSARLEDPSAYYRPSDNLAVLDLHDQNAILEGNGTFLRVFDNIMLHPTGALRATFERLAAKNAKPATLPASDRILAAAAKTNTSPSKAQIDAENYETGKVTVHGLRLSIENPAGSVRRGTDANGKAWEVTMPHHYGRILGTTGADKDHVDFFLGPDPTSPMAFVVNQKKPGNGHFDEHKVMLGFTNPGTAARGYLDSYSKGWRGYSSIVPMTIPQFKHWLDTGKMGEAVTKAPVVSIDTKPLAINPRLKAWANVPGQGDPDSLQTGYISGKHSADIAQRAKERGDIGLLITPLIPSYVNHTSDYPFIAVDNGVFSKATPFSPENFKSLVSKLATDDTLRNKTLFVVAPDVVGDAAATLQKFPSWAQWIHEKDLPVALAAQDGLEDMLEQMPWKDIDVLFIGGSTEWKTGELSMKQRAKWAQLFMETQRHGIPIHMGRVNTNERIAGVAQLVGASTVDGTFLAFGPDKNLPKLEAMLDRLIVDDKDLGAQTFPELGRAIAIQELYDLALDENIREPDQLGAYEPAAKEINAIRVSLGLPSMDGHRDQLELTLAASPRQILDATSNRQPLPAAPDMLDYQTWGKDKATRDSEWKRYRTDMAKWEAKVDAFASKQGNLGTFLAPLKSYPDGQAYHEARIITRVPGGATRWRATIFGQQPITATSTPVGDWANNAWVPVAHNEFETKAEAYQSTANNMPEGYTFSSQPLFASNRSTLAAAPRFVEQVSRASFNHLDRKLTAAIARQAKRVTSTDAVTAATQAASAWWNQDTPGVSTLRSLKELVQRELIPETVLPREVMSAMREMQIKQSMGQQKALDVGRALSGKPKFSDLHYPPEFVENPMYREQMFTAMETGTVGSLPPALQKMAQQLRQMLVDAGREAVTQGRMNPDTFEGLRTNFMPRFTKEEAQANAGDFAKRFKLGVKDILAQRSTAFHITDQARKDKTGLPQIISHSRGKWRFDSQQSRDAYYEDLINRQTLEGDLAKNDMAWMNRGDARALRAITPDMLKAPATMTKEQRDVVARVQRQLRQQFKKESPYEPADLVKDPVYAVMRYLAQMTHDNATAEFFNIIASNADWTSPTEMKGFKEIPDNDRFGALAGKYVRKDIADQVMELANTPEMVIQLYDTLLRLWKTGKTVLNPATHARNVIGNLPFAQFAGNNALNPANWTHYGHAFRTLRAGGDEYRHLYESGVLGADYASTELRAALENIVPVVQEDDSSNPLKHLLALGNRAAQWGKAHSLANVATLSTVGATAGFIAAGPLGALAGAALAGAANPIYRGALFAYRMEDDLFKAAAFFKARAMGMTIEQAAQHVRDWFPYYDKPTSTTLKFAGRTTMPFLSFFRESARIGAKAMAERPLSLAVTLAIPSLITALSAAVLGLDDKDKEDIKAAMRGKGAKLLGPTPLAGVPIFSMLIPWRTDSGQIQQIDLSSTHPMADFLANRVENWNNDPWWQAWSRSALANPMLGALYSAATGRDPFGDRTLWDSSYTPEEKARAILGHAWKTAVPPLAPGGTNWTMIEQSTRRQANKTLALRSPMQAVGRGIGGIDVRSADPDIYGLADAFRKRRGLPVTEGNTAYPTDAAGRARKALFEELVQPQPSPAALAKQLQSLNNLGKPIRTVADVLDILDYRRPDGVINPKELRAPFRASLAPEARRVLDTALREFQKARQATPGAFAKARQQVKATTRAPITDAP